jgi:hypothetical protein
MPSGASTFPTRALPAGPAYLCPRFALKARCGYSRTLWTGCLNALVFQDRPDLLLLLCSVRLPKQQSVARLNDHELSRAYCRPTSSLMTSARALVRGFEGCVGKWTQDSYARQPYEHTEWCDGAGELGVSHLPSPRRADVVTMWREGAMKQRVPRSLKPGTHRTTWREKHRRREQQSCRG